MGELEGVLVAQQIGCDEGAGRRHGGRRIDPGQGGGERKIRAIAEDRRRAQQMCRVRRQMTEPRRDAVRDRARTELKDVARVLGGRREALPPDRVEQRHEVQRVTPGTRRERCRERRRGLVAEALARKSRRRFSAQHSRPHDHSDRIRQQFRDQLGDVCLFGRTRADKQQQREALEPTRQVDKPPQRRLVCPMQVVDHEQGRRARREIGGKPIQAMQHRERRLSPIMRCRLRRGREKRSSKRGRTGQEIGPDFCRGGRQRPLEQLPDDPERKLTLELATASGQRNEPGRPGTHPRLGQQPCLPDSRAALDDDKTTVAAIRRTEHGPQRSKLGLTLEHEQRNGGLQHMVCGHRDPRAEPRGAREECRLGRLAPESCVIATEQA